MRGTKLKRAFVEIRRAAVAAAALPIRRRERIHAPRSGETIRAGAIRAANRGPLISIYRGYARVPRLSSPLPSPPLPSARAGNIPTRIPAGCVLQRA